MHCTYHGSFHPNSREGRYEHEGFRNLQRLGYVSMILHLITIMIMMMMMMLVMMMMMIMMVMFDAPYFLS
jgi:hypothetical protein